MPLVCDQVEKMLQVARVETRQGQMPVPVGIGRRQVGVDVILVPTSGDVRLVEPFPNDGRITHPAKASTQERERNRGPFTL